jgi:hypothetical protein
MGLVGQVSIAADHRTGREGTIGVMGEYPLPCDIAAFVRQAVETAGGAARLALPADGDRLNAGIGGTGHDYSEGAGARRSVSWSAASLAFHSAIRSWDHRAISVSRCWE